MTHTTLEQIHPQLQPETLAVYETTIRDMLDQELNYRDVLGEAAVPADAIMPSAPAYAKELAELKDGGEWDKVEEAASDIRGRFEVVRSLLPDGIVLSEFADSKSWIMWDIAKMEHLKTEAEAAGYDEDYTYRNTGSVLDEWFDAPDRDRTRGEHQFSMRDVVAERHLGWELYQLFRQGADMSWIETLPLHSDAEIDEEQARLDAKGLKPAPFAGETLDRSDLLQKVFGGELEKEDGQLPSHVYATLGGYVSKGLRARTEQA